MESPKKEVNSHFVSPMQTIYTTVAENEDYESIEAQNRDDIIINAQL
jgi:hypothetical protein